MEYLQLQVIRIPLYTMHGEQLGSNKMAARELPARADPSNETVLILKWHATHHGFIIDSKKACTMTDLPGHCLLTGDRHMYKVGYCLSSVADPETSGGRVAGGGGGVCVCSRNMQYKPLN